MRIATAGDPQTLDPRYARELFSVHHVHLLYQGLFRKSCSGATLPALCAKYACEGTVYRFWLREAYWSNGEPITAEDVVRSWKSVMGSDAPFAYQFSPIDSLDAESRTILRVQLKEVDPYFVEVLATNSFFPVHRNPDVYSGPFVLKEWIPHQHLVLTRNPYYWDPLSIDVEEVVFEKLHDMVALRLFESGHLEWVGAPLGHLPLDSLPALKGKALSTPALATRFVRVNVDRVPLGVRENLFSTLNREELVQLISRSGEKAAYTLLPPLFALEEAWEGEAAQKVPQLKLIYILNETNHLIAQVLEKQWGLELQGCNPKVYYQLLETRAYDLALGSWYAGTWDPLHFMEFLKYPNETGWSSARYAALLDAAGKETEGEERKKILYAAQRILREEIPIIPLYYPTFVHLCKEECAQIQINPLGLIDFHALY